MNVRDQTLNVIHQRLQALSTDASPEQLAYLAKSFETIAGSGKMIDIANLADEKLAELLDKTSDHIKNISDAKSNAESEISSLTNTSIIKIASTKSQISSSINALASKKSQELSALMADFKKINDIPNDSSILGEIQKESQKHKFIQPNAIPFLFGILSRSNDNYGVGNLTSELGKWSTTAADSMLQLLAGCHDYTTEYAGFYKEPALCFLQGSKGNFIQKEMFLKYAASTNMYQYPYAGIGVFFIKNTTEKSISTTLNFGGSSAWSSGYEGSSVFLGIPNSVEKSLNWTNIYSYTSSAANFSGSANLCVPGNTTVAVLFYTSAWYNTTANSYYVQFLHWYVHQFRSATLTSGLEIDTEKTLKAWRGNGLSTTYSLWR